MVGKNALMREGGLVNQPTKPHAGAPPLQADTFGVCIFYQRAFDTCGSVVIPPRIGGQEPRKQSGGCVPPYRSTHAVVCVLLLVKCGALPCRTANWTTTSA
jgi:hypothetical protein